MEGFDELWAGGPRFMQRGGGFRLSTDSVMLADFVNVKKARRCLDLGSGAGVLCVLLAAKAPDMCITGIELQEDWAELSRVNLKENGMDSHVDIITGDLRQQVRLLPAGSFDLVVSNPPYFSVNSGYSAPDESRAAARDERSCTLWDVCFAAGWALRWGGSLCIVHRPERLSEIFCSMTANGIEPKRLREVCPKAGRAPSLVLVEGRRGGKSGLSFEPPLILTDDNGLDSAEARRIYRRGEFSPDAGRRQTQ